MKSVTHISLFFVFWLMSYPTLSIASEFKLVKQDKNISLYERWIPSKNGEPVRELKTVFMVKSNIHSIVQLLKNNDKGTDWNTNSSVYEIKSSIPGHSWFTYIKYDMPWPFNDQDCCLLYQLQMKNAGMMVINFSSSENQHFPVIPETDRIAGVRGEWVLEELDNSITQVTYLITTDKSKKIPRWISDPIVHNNMFNTMISFKNILEHNG